MVVQSAAGEMQDFSVVLGGPHYQRMVQWGLIQPGLHLKVPFQYDSESLADLDSSFSIIREMKLAPFGKENVIRFLVIIALPLAPLLRTMFSAEELLKRLFSVVV
jgi:hypothetical protein